MISLSKYTLEVIAILPAAGVGSRMNSTLPKQYLMIDNKTILEYAIESLLCQFCISKVIVAISSADIWYHKLPVSTNPRVHAVIGGIKRAHSVLAALYSLNSGSWILVHDAVRPCLRQEDLCRLLSITKLTSIGGLLAVPVRDTMKRAYSGTTIISNTVERKDLWHALTPQLFSLKLLKKCLRLALIEGIDVTDEASALEHYGYMPLLIPGSADNIKITNPEDLELARFFLSNLSKKF